MTEDRLGRIVVKEGTPYIRGQRLRVSDVLELLDKGGSFEEILASHSSLEREDIYAALEYAGQQADNTRLQPR